MKIYSVSFQIFDRNLMVKVEAKTPEEAATYVRSKIDIKKIEEFVDKPKQPQSAAEEFFKKNLGIDINDFKI